MARIAQLHDGTQLGFPDEIDDNQMDQLVQQHMGVPPPPPMPTPEEMMAFVGQQIMQVTQVAMQLTQAVEQVTRIAGGIAMGQQELTKQLGAVGAEIQKLMPGLGMVVEQTRQAAGAAQQGFEAFAGAQQSHTAAVQEMKDTLERGTAEMVRAVTAPKKLVTDKAGKPIGTRTEMGAEA